MNSLILPIITEKSMMLVDTRNTYVFAIEKSINKIELKKQIEKQFDVQVIDINITNIDGKPKNSLRIGDRSKKALPGKRKDIRKAYVRLADGQKIPGYIPVKEKGSKD